MATWIDLTAHNLALWRVGEDRNGKRRYVLLPVFPENAHTIPDPASTIGKAFQWRPEVGGYVLNLRYETEALPGRAQWFDAFPGALLQDRDVCTFPIRQPSMLNIHTLPLKNPWVWSNQENPERFYANEEQALNDGAGGAVLRGGDEVDSRGVRETTFAVEGTALEEISLDADTPAEASEAEDVAPQEVPAFLMDSLSELVTLGDLSGQLREAGVNAVMTSDVINLLFHLPLSKRATWVPNSTIPESGFPIIDHEDLEFDELMRVPGYALVMPMADIEAYTYKLALQAEEDATMARLGFDNRDPAEAPDIPVSIPLLSEDDDLESSVLAAPESPESLLAQVPEEQDAAAATSISREARTESIRVDYGEHIPGARKEAWESVQSDLDVQMRLLETTGKYDPKAIQVLAGKMRRDVIWGTLEDRLAQPDVAASPLKQVLWTTLYQQTPASVKSSYWSGSKKRGVPEENLYLRVVAYPEVLRSIERRMNALGDDFLGTLAMGEQLSRLLNGDILAKKPDGADVFTDLYPSGPYDRLPDRLRDSALFIFPVSMVSYAELLDDPYYGAMELLSGLKKENTNRLRTEMVQTLLDASLQGVSGNGNNGNDDALHDDLTDNMHRYFMSLKEAAMNVEECAEREMLERFIAYEDKGLLANIMNASFSSDAVKNADRHTLKDMVEQHIERKLNVADIEFDQKARNPSSMIREMVDSVDLSRADQSILNENESYRNRRIAEAVLADQTCQVMAALVNDAREIRQNHAKYGAEAAQEEDSAAATAEEGATTQDTAVAETVAVDSAGMPMQWTVPADPEFIRWNPESKPLPPEHTDMEGYRAGPETPRQGDDVTEQQLCETFGLRAVQYGNWMTQKDRQEHLNAAFDGLHDVQHMIGIENSKVMGLPRLVTSTEQRQTLAIALGARGKGGRFMAHYEPSLHVINMTKTRGAGSLLHEWTHAMDWQQGAEITRGAVVAASKLSGNPLGDYANILKQGSGNENILNEVVRRQIVIEHARKRVIPIIGTALLSKKIQESLLSDLRYCFGKRQAYELTTRYEQETLQIKEGLLQKEGRTVTYADIRAQEVIGEAEGVRQFEQFLPKLVAAADKLLARLDAAMVPDDDRKGVPIRVSEMVARSHEILVYPVYDPAQGRTMNFNKESSRRFFRDLVGGAPVEDAALGEMQKKALHGEPDITPEDISMARWTTFATRDYWKSLCGKMVNKNPYSEESKVTSNISLFMSNAMTLDGKKVVDNPYWSAPHELLARNMASIGYDKLQADGVTNTYLTDSVPERFSGEHYRADPDPQGAERTLFAQSFFEEVLPQIRESLEKAVEQAEQMQESPVMPNAQEEEAKARLGEAELLLAEMSEHS
jgi:hypothetical protein